MGLARELIRNAGVPTEGDDPNDPCLTDSRPRSEWQQEKPWGPEWVPTALIESDPGRLALNTSGCTFGLLGGWLDRCGVPRIEFVAENLPVVRRLLGNEVA